MKKTKILYSLLLLCSFSRLAAQDDLLNELSESNKAKKEVVDAAFKGMQITTMQSTKLAAKNEWYFLVSHRFGDLTNGLDNFFGLDNALTKIGGLYGVSNWLTLGFSRHTYNKTYELSGKVRFLQQKVDGFPVTVVGYTTTDINTNLKTEVYPDLQGSDRLAYSFQLPISRKFSKSFSLEVNPIYIHKNLIDANFEKDNQFLVAGGGRYKLSKRLSLNLEYAQRIDAPENDYYHNPLTVGLDIETGGHVFQLVFSNSQAINDVAYFTNALGQWDDKGIFFGFNMYRVF